MPAVLHRQVDDCRDTVFLLHTGPHLNYCLFQRRLAKTLLVGGGKKLMTLQMRKAADAAVEFFVASG